MADDAELNAKRCHGQLGVVEAFTLFDRRVRWIEWNSGQAQAAFSNFKARVGSGGVFKKHVDAEDRPAKLRHGSAFLEVLSPVDQVEDVLDIQLFYADEVRQAKQLVVLAGISSILVLGN